MPNQVREGPAALLPRRFPEKQVVDAGGDLGIGALLAQGGELDEEHLAPDWALGAVDGLVAVAEVLPNRVDCVTGLRRFWCDRFAPRSAGMLFLLFRNNIPLLLLLLCERG